MYPIKEEAKLAFLGAEIRHLPHSGEISQCFAIPLVGNGSPKKISLSPAAAEEATASFLASSHHTPLHTHTLSFLSERAQAVNVFVKPHLDIFQMCSLTSEPLTFQQGEGDAINRAGCSGGRLPLHYKGTASLSGLSSSQDTARPCFQWKGLPEVFSCRRLQAWT